MLHKLVGKYRVQSSQVVQWERIHQSMQETQEMWVPSLSQEDNPGGGNGNPLQYSCLENPMGRADWRALVPRVTESDTTEQLSTHANTVSKSLLLHPRPRVGATLFDGRELQGQS
ncbi:unnamed protein product [Rangifer tarandus platyrhynchus]|uniref:Uncharacterized protein n=1 Tax=Rangifer tarandus platyrhynchus TaxID=3082113 RepID=A0AC59Z255_RANTA